MVSYGSKDRATERAYKEDCWWETCSSWCPFSGLCFFFFSSRRRHTRYIGDWSSDCALPICLLHGVRDRLLEVHVLALGQGFERHGRVPVVGGGDDDGVHVRAIEDLAVVEAGVGLRELRRLPLAPGVDVAHRHHLRGQLGIGLPRLRRGAPEQRR